MSSPFTLTIDWLSFTSQWDGKGDDGGPGRRVDQKPSWLSRLSVSWMTVASDRGVGKLGTGAPRSPLEVHVDLSAGIVSAWPTTKVRTVLQWVLSHEGHLTRLDCALDDRTSTVSHCTPSRQAIEAGQCVTRADRMQTIASSSIHKGTPSGETLYIGSPHSQTLLRIYDKRAELQPRDGKIGSPMGFDGNCNSSKSAPRSVVRYWRISKRTDWLEFIIGVLRAYVDFRETSREEPDEDRYRSPLLGWWKELTEGFQKGRLVVEKDTQSLPKVKRWVKHSVAPMLAVICAHHPDGQAWLEKQIVAAVGRWKTKHRAWRNPARPAEKTISSAGENAGAPSQGGEGVSARLPLRRPTSCYSPSKICRPGSISSPRRCISGPLRERFPAKKSMA